MEKPKCKDKTCENFGKYCRKHPEATLKKEVKIKEVSEKRREINKEYSKVRAKYLKAHPFCEAGLQGCKKVAMDLHHKRGRATEEHLLNEKEFMAVCRPCHTLIEQNPAYSKAMGFSKPRLSKRV